MDQTFDGRCALNYAHAGRIRWAMGEGETRELIAPVFWWTWPGPRFRYGWKEAPGWDHYYATFSGQWVDELRTQGWLDATTAEPFCAIGNAKEAMEALQSDLARRDSFAAWSRLLGLLRDIRDAREANDRPKHSQKIRILMEAIRHKPEADWGEAEAARRCGLSAPHFRRLFRAEARLPFRQFCLRTRMDRAAALARGSDLPIKEIAARCGVGDVYQFSRLFSAHHGLPPGQYRRAVRLMG